MEFPSHPSNSTHCQRLTLSAQKLGFASYESLRNYLSNPPQDRISSVYQSIMRKVCSIRLTDDSKEYLQMHCIDRSCITYSGELVGEDLKGNLVRRPYLTSHRNENLIISRELYVSPYYVINTKSELLAWFRDWQGIAYVSGELTKEELSELYVIPKLKPIRPFKFGLWGPEPDLDAEAEYEELLNVLQKEEAECESPENGSVILESTDGIKEVNELEALFHQLKLAIV